MPDTHYILKGTDNNFTSIWIFNNRMYVGSDDYLTVVELSNDTVSDWYSETHAGRGVEVLDADDMVDINIVSR